MAAPSIEPSARPRPKPGPGSVPADLPAVPARRGRRWGQRGRQDPVQAAGNAIVAAAKVGRILGRSGWRIARQLPGVALVEQVVEQVVEQQVARLTNPEEERAARLAAFAATDPAPLRTAMTELLDRSSHANPDRSRDYLFGTIVSQLVPDEARILAALATHPPFAVVDVVGKKDGRPHVANVSTVAHAAGVALPGNAGTYLDRLDGFGLLEFHDPQPAAERVYAALAGEPAVRAVLHGGTRLVRRSVTLSPLGREFWAACAPSA